MNENFDYIVVGAGSAGSVLADRLSADGRYSVCILEAGPGGDSFTIRTPGAFAAHMFLKKYNWAFNASPDLTTLSYEVSEALGSIDVVLGKTTADEILNEIFSSFCVGK